MLEELSIVPFFFLSSINSNDNSCSCDVEGFIVSHVVSVVPPGFFFPDKTDVTAMVDITPAFTAAAYRIRFKAKQFAHSGICTDVNSCETSVKRTIR